MERVKRIWEHKEYQKNLELIKQAEETRIFCLHNMSHFLDVARIASIMNLEEGYGVEKEYIYAAALLHDIGRKEQYEKGIPHEEASVVIAKEILKDCNYSEEEIGMILEAIGEHGNREVMDRKDLVGLLYRADKACRACFSCDSKDLCNWSEEKKNLTLRY